MSKKRIRSIVKQVFLSEEEHQKLLELMRQANVTQFSTFARRKLLRSDFKIWLVNFPEYRSITNELLVMGRRINSIAKLSTQLGNISTEDFVELGKLISQLFEVMEQQLMKERQEIKRK